MREQERRWVEQRRCRVNVWVAGGIWVGWVEKRSEKLKMGSWRVMLNGPE